MDTLINAVSWVVGKALAPVTGTVLEDWAAKAGLGANVHDLTTELRCVRALLRNWSSRRTENDDNNPDLKDLMRMLRGHAYEADDVLDKLDYFRLQDVIYGTSEAADEHAKGCCHNLFLNTRHTAKAVGKELLRWSACSPAATHEGSRRRPHPSSSDEQEAIGCMRKLFGGACNTVRHVGNRLPCSSQPPVRHDDENNIDLPAMVIPHGASIHEAPQRHAPEPPKLQFNRVDISKRMRLIVEQMRPIRQEITNILTVLGSNYNTARPDIAQTRRPSTISESVEPKIYGRDPIMNNIIYNITRGEYSDKNLTVLPIVGHGGIGKTTLAQYIYQNQEVKQHFQVMVWKCVSFNFNADKLTQDIEKYIPPVKDETMGTTGELIGQRLKSKRFLLVLDDMWECSDEDEWKKLLLPFKKSQEKGNIIIVTTRCPALAIMVKTTQYPVQLEGLDQESFKDLFLAYVFGNEQLTQEYTLLLETGYKIMDKLKGSPLSAKTVGRLLRNNLGLDHWIRVLESKQWELQKGEYDIMPALKLSYDYLRFDLQQCFSYCALFPQDHKFKTEELIHFWIGHGILHSNDLDNINLEDTGLRNINDLISHGFFKKEESMGEDCYTIHDLLHDLALKVASHECLSVYLYNEMSGNIPSSILHLSNILDSSNGTMTDENLKIELRKVSTKLKVEKLRSLMIFGKLTESFAIIVKDLFGEANALCLLCLSEVVCDPTSILHNLLVAVHLRYLRLGRSDRTICRSQLNLSSMLSRFYHLNTLDLQEWNGHINFPRNMSNLLNLCHFQNGHSHYPFYPDISNVGKLQFLQKLNVFRVNKESSGFELKQLGSLIELRELGIFDLEKVHTKEEALEAKLKEKIYLRKLHLNWDTARVNNIEHDAQSLVLESLQPHKKLHVLSIRGHRGLSCPTWLGDHISSALRRLYLRDIAWEVFPPLGHMWVLEELTLENVATLKEFGPSHFGSITEQSFCKLKKLRVDGLQQLENWVLGDTYHLLSQLQELSIINCPQLLELPFQDLLSPTTRNGLEEKIHWFPNLKSLAITSCPKVKMLPLIPWTQTLSFVDIMHVGSSLVDSLNYHLHPLGYLFIAGKDGSGSLEQILIFDNLIQLSSLHMYCCPPIEMKHLQMLTSLGHFFVCNSSRVFVPLESEEVKFQLPILKLSVASCGAYTAKELTKLLPYLPKLQSFFMMSFDKIKRIVVVLEQEYITKEQETVDDDMIIFPGHLCDSTGIFGA